MATATAVLEMKDFKADVSPDWCAGCGDFGVLNALAHACAELGRQPHEILVETQLHDALGSALVDGHNAETRPSTVVHMP